MINLLPPHEKKILFQEYKHRRLIVGLVFGLSAIIIMAILLIPSLIVVMYREGIAKRAVAEIAVDTAKHNSLLADLRTSKVLITALTPQKGDIAPSLVITPILNAADTGVSVSDVLYSVTGVGEFKVDVRGSARTRQSLVNFTTNLKKQSMVTKLDLPVSNLAKDTDIQFAFTLEGKSQ